MHLSCFFLVSGKNNHCFYLIQINQPILHASEPSFIPEQGHHNDLKPQAKNPSHVFPQVVDESITKEDSTILNDPVDLSLENSESVFYPPPRIILMLRMSLAATLLV